MSQAPIGIEQVIGAAKRLEAARVARGATNTQAEWEATLSAVKDAERHLQAAVLDVGVVMWLARLDD